METPDVTVPNHTPIATAPRDIDAIKAQEKDCTLPFWNGNVAFKLGVNLRTRLLTEERPAVVHISTISTPPHVLFHAVRSSLLDIAPSPLPFSFFFVAMEKKTITSRISTHKKKHQTKGEMGQFKTNIANPPPPGNTPRHLIRQRRLGLAQARRRDPVCRQHMAAAEPVRR